MQRHFVFLAQLSTETETDLSSPNASVPIPHGCETKRFVLACVFFVTDADERRFDRSRTTVASAFSRFSFFRFRSRATMLLRFGETLLL